MFRHVPPTAVPIKATDLWRGLAAMWEGRRTLDELRSSVQVRTGSAGCYLLSSGRAALTVILLGVKRLSQASKVIVPAYSCPTVVQSVLAAGLDPLLCDVSPETLDLDRAALAHIVAVPQEDAEPKLSHSPLGIVPVHLYGWALDVRDLVALGDREGIFVVEDAAQALGATFQERPVGTLGDAGLYSLGRGKCLPAGRGGVVVTGERCAPAIAEVMAEVGVRSMPTRGQEGERAAAEPSHPHSQRAVLDVRSLALLAGYALATHPAGWWLVARTRLNPAGEGMDAETLPPIRLDLLSPTVAGIATSLLARLSQDQAVRRRNAMRLMALSEKHHFLSVPAIAPGAEPAFLRLPVVVDDPERAGRLFTELWRRGIGVSRSYRRSLPDLFSGALGTDERHFPGAARLARCLLTLPTHAYLRDSDFDRIAAALRAS